MARPNHRYRAEAEKAGELLKTYASDTLALGDKAAQTVTDWITASPADGMGTICCGGFATPLLLNTVRRRLNVRRGTREQPPS